MWYRDPTDSYIITPLLAKLIPLYGKDQSDSLRQQGIHLDFDRFEANTHKYIDDIKNLLIRYHVDYHQLISFRSEWDIEQNLEIQRTIGIEGKKFDWHSPVISSSSVIDAIEDEMLQRWPDLRMSLEKDPDIQNLYWNKVHVDPGPRHAVWVPFMKSELQVDTLKWLNGRELKDIEKRLRHFKSDSDKKDLRYDFNLFSEEIIRRWFLDHGWEVPLITTETKAESPPESMDKNGGRFSLDKSRPDTKWYREELWPQLTSRLEETRRIGIEDFFYIIKERRRETPDDKRRKKLLASFIGYVNKNKGKAGKLTAKIDYEKEVIVLTEKRRK